MPLIWIVGVAYNNDAIDPIGYGTKKDIESLKIGSVSDVRALATYIIEGDLSEQDVKRICEELLVDNQIQHYSYCEVGEGDYLKRLVKGEDLSNAWIVEVRFLPGVMDAVGLSTKQAIEVLGIKTISGVRTATTYIIKGDIGKETLETICKKLLFNSLIQSYKCVKVGGV